MRLSRILLLSLALALLGLANRAQAQTVSGTVTDDLGTELIGVSVLVQGSASGTVTDPEGNFSVRAQPGDVLLISYIGMLTREVRIREGKTRYNVALQPDVRSLSDVVVTATRQPVRKIQTTTAITTIGDEYLEETQPASFAEAITSVPGVTVENSQGRKAFYNIRGFPSGNTYVTTLQDGIPLSAFASRSAGQTEFLGLDRNIERIEVVRGSGATLFGRAAGAGAVNIISKTGGEELRGTVSATWMNNLQGDDLPNSGDLDYQVDVNLNGPLTEKLRYNVGGYLLRDSGFKEWARKDKGAQFRANFDYLIDDKSSVRVYGMYGNNQFNNLVDSPYKLDDGELADGWTNRNTYYADTRDLDFESTLVSSVFAPAQFRRTLTDVNGNEITQNQVEDNREEVIGGNVGITLNLNLVGELYLVQKNRYQVFDWRDHNELTFSSFYTPESSILRLNANSDGITSDFFNETRLQYRITGDKSVHNLSGGFYLSAGEYDRFGGLHWYQTNVDPRPDRFWFGGSPLQQVFSLSSTTSHQEEKVTSFFLGDEMVFDEKLSINVGVRYDQMTGFFDNDPREIDGLDYDPDEVEENELDFSDFSFSVGANYLFSDRSAVYGSIVRAFSLPSVGLNTPLPEENEIVVNAELGYRFGVGDLGVDFGAYHTNISNRVATVFDPQAANGQTFVARPVGTNTVTGAELQLTYAPSTVKGLLLRGSLTFQESRYRDFQIALAKNSDGETNVDTEGDLFGLDLVEINAETNDFAIDVADNRVQNTPSFIASFNANYSARYWGIGLDAVHYAGRYATALNLLETPDLTVINANLYGQIDAGAPGNKLRLGLRVRNLFDFDSPQQYVLGSTNDALLVQKQQTPDFDGVLGFGISQIPRRVLLTLSYDF